MRKENIIIIFTCISVTLVIIILLWLNCKSATSYINIESYIGIIATLIGVCATIIVGFQIAHFIEMRNLKEQIDELNKLRLYIDSKSSELEKI